jgi:two-component system LytT family sensor kinase
MKTNCEACGAALSPEADAYVCASDCTFCAACRLKQKVCPRCGGELVRRPRRISAQPDQKPRPTRTLRPFSALVWGVSFAVWAFICVAATFTFWELYRSTEMPMPFVHTLGLELSQVLTYFPLTPFVFAFAIKYPVRRDNWKRRSLQYLAAGALFSLVHILLRGVTPFAIYDSKARDWTSAFWSSKTHSFSIQLLGLKRLYFNNLIDDITGVFVPIVLVAHAISYYFKFQDRELRASQLEAQLAKSHLQSLKSQLQPHFLFNTMHSISALMLTDVRAADRMITRLADLLRMNLESAGTQITTLNRELEFVNCYLEIEQVRFEERLTLNFDIAPETLDAHVPLLLLQPLVDNAVKHGISRMTSGGSIRISSRIEGEDLKLEVKDNGPGFGNQSSDRGCGLGLRVTRERLETLYGENQSIELISPPEGGVAVLVTIPFEVAPEKTAITSPSDASGEAMQLQESA